MKTQYYAASNVFEDDIIICGADTETEGLGGKLLMVQWGMLGKVYHDSSPQMMDNFFNVLLDYPKPCVWFLHNAQYDWRYMMEYIAQHKLITEICLRTEHDIYEIRVKRSDDDEWSVMRDSMALWPHSLKKLAQTFSPEIPKLNVDIINFDPQNPEHITYAKRDVQILLTALPRLFTLLQKHFGVTPSATTAGTSMRAWQKTIPKGQYFNSSKYDEKELFIREGYYGGLVFLTSNSVHHNCITYDRNSSYPASMLKYGVPYGEPAYTTEYEDDHPGIYRCRVTAPDDLIVPILPARNIRGAMRWYRGSFDTVVTTQELQFAAKHGYVIEEIYEGYYFSGMCFPFNDFIGHCRDLRNEFKNQPIEILAKLNQNSLYGKFCSRRERNRVVTIRDGIEDTIPLDDYGYWYVKKELDDEMKCLPQWGVFITANSRLALLEQVYTIGPENVIYGDTDSITIKAGNEHGLDVGSEYGQWKREKVWKTFRAIAPKVYTGILGEDFKSHKAGEFMGAAKGLPQKGITEKQWSELLERGETRASTMSLDSLIVSIKKGVRPVRQLTRISSSLDNSQNFIDCGNGDVRVKYSHG